jgi:hypothetical protein
MRTRSPRSPTNFSSTGLDYFSDDVADEVRDGQELEKVSQRLGERHGDNCERQLRKFESKRFASAPSISSPNHWFGKFGCSVEELQLVVSQVLLGLS